MSKMLYDFQEVDQSVFKIPGVDVLDGKQYFYPQTRFKGYKEEISKLISYLREKKSESFHVIEIGAEISEVQLFGEETVPQLIRKFPCLKATGLRENFNNSMVQAWLSESGFSVLTKCENTSCFDPRSDGGDARWECNYDMMERVHCSFEYLQTSDLIEVYYTYPFQKEWEKDDYLYEENGKIYERINASEDVFTVVENCLTGYSGHGKAVTIPKRVLSISSEAFKGNSFIVSVHIPGSVKVVDGFQDCLNLQEVTIEEGVEEIADRAFCNCNRLMHIVLPQSLHSIGSYAFEKCKSLAAISLPESLRELGRSHNRFDMLEGGVFNNCINLTELWIPDSVTDLVTHSLCYDCQKLQTVTLPHIDRIEQMAFSGCQSLRMINLPEGLRQISRYAFSNCGQLEISKFPETLEAIEYGAFQNCYSLDLSNLSLPVSITRVERKAFEGCKNVPSLLLNQDASCLFSCYFPAEQKVVNLPLSVHTIQDGAFYACDELEEVTCPEGLVRIGAEAFSMCRNLRKINFPVSLRTIGQEAFWCCENLREALLPDGLQELGSEAFLDCLQLKKARIPATLSKISSRAFSKCQSMVELVLEDGIEEIEESAFTECKTMKSVVLPNSLKSIGNRAFYKCSKLENIVIPDELEYLGIAAFANCDLKSINVPNRITELIYTFYSNKKLAKVSLPTGLSLLGSNVFGSCDALDSITIPSTVTELGKGCFYECQNLKRVELMEGLKVIEEEAFKGCTLLKAVSLPSTIESLGKSAFSESGIENVIIPGSISTISNSAFQGCSYLKQAVITDGVEKIGMKAFSFCPNLKKLEIRGLMKKKYGKDVLANSPNVVVYGIPGSIAEDLAREADVPFFNLEGEAISKNINSSEKHIKVQCSFCDKMVVFKNTLKKRSTDGSTCIVCKKCCKTYNLSEWETIPNTEIQD